MKRTLLTVLLAGAVSSAAFAEGAVAQAPGKLLVLTELETQISSAATAATHAGDVYATERYQAVTHKLNEQLDAQLRERMQRDLAVAMQ